MGFKLGLPDWYGHDGQFITTKFFGMKANKYIHDHARSGGTCSSSTGLTRQKPWPGTSHGG